MFRKRNSRSRQSYSRNESSIGLNDTNKTTDETGWDGRLQHTSNFLSNSFVHQEDSNVEHKSETETETIDADWYKKVRRSSDIQYLKMHSDEDSNETTKKTDLGTETKTYNLMKKMIKSTPKKWKRLKVSGSSSDSDLENDFDEILSRRKEELEKMHEINVKSQQNTLPEEEKDINLNENTLEGNFPNDDIEYEIKKLKKSKFQQFHNKHLVSSSSEDTTIGSFMPALPRKPDSLNRSENKTDICKMNTHNPFLDENSTTSYNKTWMEKTSSHNDTLKTNMVKQVRDNDFSIFSADTEPVILNFGDDVSIHTSDQSSISHTAQVEQSVNDSNEVLSRNQSSSLKALEVNKSRNVSDENNEQGINEQKSLNIQNESKQKSNNRNSSAELNKNILEMNLEAKVVVRDVFQDLNTLQKSFSCNEEKRNYLLRGFTNDDVLQSNHSLRSYDEDLSNVVSKYSLRRSGVMNEIKDNKNMKKEENQETGHSQENNQQPTVHHEKSSIKTSFNVEEQIVRRRPSVLSNIFHNESPIKQSNVHSVGQTSHVFNKSVSSVKSVDIEPSNASVSNRIESHKGNKSNLSLYSFVKSLESAESFSKKLISHTSDSSEDEIGDIQNQSLNDSSMTSVKNKSFNNEGQDSDVNETLKNVNKSNTSDASVQHTKRHFVDIDSCGKEKENNYFKNHSLKKRIIKSEKYNKSLDSLDNTLQEAHNKTKSINGKENIYRRTPDSERRSEEQQLNKDLRSPCENPKHKKKEAKLNASRKRLKTSPIENNSEESIENNENILKMSTSSSKITSPRNPQATFFQSDSEFDDRDEKCNTPMKSSREVKKTSLTTADQSASNETQSFHASNDKSNTSIQRYKERQSKMEKLNDSIYSNEQVKKNGSPSKLQSPQNRLDNLFTVENAIGDKSNLMQHQRHQYTDMDLSVAIDADVPAKEDESLTNLWPKKRLRSSALQEKTRIENEQLDNAKSSQSKNLFMEVISLTPSNERQLKATKTSEKSVLQMSSVSPQKNTKESSVDKIPIKKIKNSQTQRSQLFLKPVQMTLDEFFKVKPEEPKVLPPSELGQRYRCLQQFDEEHGDHLSEELMNLRIKLMKDDYVMQETKRIQRELAEKREKERVERLKKKELEEFRKRKEVEAEQKKKAAEERKRKKQEREALIPNAFKVDGKVYKPPPLPRPRKWCTDRLYKYLQKKMEPTHGLNTRVKSAKLMKYLASCVDYISKAKNYNEYKETLSKLKVTLARNEIITTHQDFNFFCFDYMPYEFRIKAIPMTLPGNELNIPDYDPSKDNNPILQS